MAAGGRDPPPAVNCGHAWRFGHEWGEPTPMCPTNRHFGLTQDRRSALQLTRSRSRRLGRRTVGWAAKRTLGSIAPAAVLGQPIFLGLGEFAMAALPRARFVGLALWRLCVGCRNRHVECRNSGQTIARIVAAESVCNPGMARGTMIARLLPQPDRSRRSAARLPCQQAAMHDTDADLMRRANKGDSSAFNQLVGRYQPALRRVALSRLGSVEAAEDVVQETFLAAYKSRHSYDERFGFRTWLWTILLNQCRRLAGRQAGGPRAMSLDVGEDRLQVARTSDNADPAGLADILACERRELLDSLLGRLSAVQADALRLRFFGGLKFQEIADAMHCSLCTAKNRVRWGLVRLSELARQETAEVPRNAGPRPSGVPATRPPSPSGKHETYPPKERQR